jgi:hypothetical protein
VLVSGGSNSSSTWGSAEIYDPALGTWSTTGSMSTNRYYHTATLLPDGRVLVSGGSNGTVSATNPWPGKIALGSAETYDPELGTWSPTPLMSTARFFHTATLLQDGRVLVSGGQTSEGQYLEYSSASAEIYDPTRDTWSPTGSMTASPFGPWLGRETHSAVLLLDGQVLVSGGIIQSVQTSPDHSGSSEGYYISETAEIYDPASGTWHVTGSMRAATRARHIGTLLSDGRVLVSGGLAYFSFDNASAELYSPADGTWSVTDRMSTPRVGHTSTLLPDGRVLVSGGSASETILASAEIYSPGAPSPDPEESTPPTLLCAAADGAWHLSDVTIACTASDLESGLANAADASFHLTTSVPAGTETTSATTNSRQVCDVVGNCSTAASITGNKVDKKAPTIAIASPMAGATYGLKAKVSASYACSDGGAGMTSCTGPVASGSLVNTSSRGTHTFAVTAIDTVGNSSTVSVTYSVVSGRK